MRYLYCSGFDVCTSWLRFRPKKFKFWGALISQCARLGDPEIYHLTGYKEIVLCNVLQMEFVNSFSLHEVALTSEKNSTVLMS
jgi:hypothetical protein